MSLAREYGVLSLRPVWPQMLYCLLLPVLLLQLAACGGSTSENSGKGPQLIEVQLSGLVTNGPLEGALVEILDAQGELLGTATTADGGLFGPVSLLVPDVSARYQLVSFGGEHDNRPYVGSLRTLCEGFQQVVNCTLTPISTVIDVLISEYEMAPGSARFQVLNRMGVSSDPFVTPSQRFDRVAARAAMDNGRLLADWVSGFVAWVREVDGATPPPGVVVADTPVDEYSLRYNAGRGGRIEGEASQQLEAAETGTAVTARADAGYTFVRWSDGLTTASRTDGPLTADLSLSAVFGPVAGNQILSVFRTGPGAGRVATDIRGIDCGTSCQASLPMGTEIALAAFADEASVFAGWGSGCTGSSPSCVLVLGDEPVSVSANFEAASYPLSLSVEGIGEGEVLVAPADFSCRTRCQEDFPYAQEVVLTAVADEGFVFSGWGGDCSGSDPECRLSLTRAISVVASFVIPLPQLRVVISGAGSGSVTGAGIECDDSCVQEVIEGSPVTLSATADEGSVFAGWSGPCAGTSPVCATVINGDTLVTAEFDVQPSNIKRLSVVRSGNGSGRVTDGLGLDCGSTCVVDYATGLTRKLVAEATPGSAFSHWVGCTSSAGPGCTVSLDTNRTVTAHFVQAEAVPLQITTVVESFEEGSVGPHHILLTFSHVIRVDDNPVGDALGVTNATVTSSECGAFFSYTGHDLAQDFLGDCSVTFVETNTNTAVDARTQGFRLTFSTIAPVAAADQVGSVFPKVFHSADTEEFVVMAMQPPVSDDRVVQSRASMTAACPAGGLRDDILWELNRLRAQARSCGQNSFSAAPPLDWSCRLETVAMNHARDLAGSDFMSEVDSDGRNLAERVSRIGYPWVIAAENLAAGQPDITSVIQSWLGNPEACARIMNPDIEEAGMGWYAAPSAPDFLFWTQILATPP